MLLSAYKVHNEGKEIGADSLLLTLESLPSPVLHIKDQFLLVSDRFCRRVLSVPRNLAGADVACGETVLLVEMSSQLSST